MLALVGENGAGKSTLMKVLSGVYPAGTYTGEILRQGQPVTFAGTSDAERHGIAIIHQELNLYAELSVVENLFVGRYLTSQWGLIDWPAMRQKAASLLGRLGVSFGPETLIKDLSVGDGQMVEIARALLLKPAVLILDEPTSALSEREVHRLYAFVEDLKASGTACIYISHKFDEIYHLCSRVVVLRDGRTVGEGKLADLGRDALISLMVGRPFADLFPAKLEAGAGTPTLSCRNVGARGRAGGVTVTDVSFDAFPGEILGIGGMMGSGRTETLYAVLGHPDFDVSGERLLDGKPLPLGTVAGAIAAGVALVTEDRKRTGLHVHLDVAQNVAMASLGRISKGQVLDLDAEQARPGTTCDASRSRLRRQRPRSSICRAATSKKSRSPKAWPPNPASFCSTSRRVASTSAPSSKSTACCASWRRKASPSSSSRPSCSSSSASVTAFW